MIRLIAAMKKLHGLKLELVLHIFCTANMIASDYYLTANINKEKDLAQRMSWDRVYTIKKCVIFLLSPRNYSLCEKIVTAKNLFRLSSELKTLNTEGAKRSPRKAAGKLRIAAGFMRMEIAYNMNYVSRLLKRELF